MKKLMSITVNGNKKTWSFNFYGNTEHLEDWWKDGLDVSEICNTVPVEIGKLGLSKLWMLIQDVFNVFNRSK